MQNLHINPINSIQTLQQLIITKICESKMNGIYIDYKLMPDSIIESIDKTLLDLQLKQ